MNIILALITGLCISVMIFFNGSLEGYIGNIATLLFIHLTAFTFTGLMFLKKSRENNREKKSRWFLLAGLLGIIVVTISNRVFSKGGVLLTLSGTLAGQVLMASIMEFITHYKVKKRVPIGKIISLLLVLPGAILIGLKSNLPIAWILLSWVPGILILVQAYMNSQNILSVGFRKTLIFHFGTALIIIIPLIFLFPVIDEITKILNGEVPLLFLLGGGTIALFVISIGSFLLLKLSPITYVLLLYSGQIGGALIIDYISGHPLSIEKTVAMGLIIAGLLSGELGKKRLQPQKM